jgi:hypothetical protein
MLLQRGLFKTFEPVILNFKLKERRIHYGNGNPLGNILNYGKGKSEEGEEIDLNGLL